MSDPAGYDEQLPDRIENLMIAEAASLSGLSAHWRDPGGSVRCL